MTVAVWALDGLTSRSGRSWADALVEGLEAEGLEVRLVDPLRFDPNSMGVDGHVLSGGATSVNEGAVGRTVQHLVQDLVRSGAPAVGVCLGAQHLASAVLAMAGRESESVVASGPGRAGLEVGVIDIVDVGSGETFRSSTFHAHEMNSALLDVVGVDLLATNSHSRVQAFRYGPVTGVQFHPELSRAQVGEAVLASPTWVPDFAARAEAIEAGPDSDPGLVRRWLMGPLGLG